MRKFKIPKIPLRTNKSIRFPENQIEKIKSAIEGRDCTFSSFVIQATRKALENLEEQNE